MALGSELRRAREQRGLTLFQLSELTKIHPSALKAIEEDDLSRLPGGIFMRGFLRAYAREVGLDPARVVREYTAGVDHPPESDAPQVKRDVATYALRPEMASPAKLASYRSDHSGLVLAIAAAAVLLLTTYYASDRSASHRSAANVQTAGAGAERTAPQPTTNASGPVETATSGISDATATHGKDSPVAATSAKDSASEAVHVELEVRDRPCWVRATADGAQVAYRLMQPGERQVIDARDTLMLRVGDPSAFTFSINGVPGAPLGVPAVPVTIRIRPGHPVEFVSQQQARPMSEAPDGSIRP
jgi:cytoskeleton protein RodZ